MRWQQYYGAEYDFLTLHDFSHFVVIHGNLTAKCYIDEVLQPVKYFLGQNNVQVLPWHAFFLDSSPVQHFWYHCNITSIMVLAGSASETLNRVQYLKFAA